jgi:hypothetical protein
MKKKIYRSKNDTRVIKKFTFLPLRIYQYTSQTTYWSWFETTYILQEWCFPSEGFYGINSNPIKRFKSYFFGGYWKNVRFSSEEEYNKKLEKSK